MPADPKREAQRKQRRREMRIRAQGVMQGVTAMLRPGDVVFDCGANVGAVTVPLAGTGATVHAFEPDPLAFATLQDALAGAPTAHLHQVCVGTSDGTAALARAADFDAAPLARTTRSTVLRGGSGMDDAGVTPVQQIDLLARIRDTVADHGPLAFLKLDIEGAELEILEAMEAEGLFSMVRLTVAELHPGKFPALRQRFRDLRVRLTEQYPPTTVFLDWT